MTVHGFEGTVQVTSTVDGGSHMVGAGQTVTTGPGGMGTLSPTPPAVSQNFQNATNVPPPGEGENGGGSGSGNGAGGSGSGGDTGSSDGSGNAGAQGEGSGTQDPTETDGGPTLPPDTSTLTQQQNTTQSSTPAPVAPKTDSVVDPKTNALGNHVGYFAGIVAKLATAAPPQDVYMSKNRYDGDGNMWARGLKNDLDYLRVEGGGGDFEDPTLKWASISNGTVNSGPISQPITKTSLGTYDDGEGHEYMEWGWASVLAFPFNGDAYAMTSGAYWLFGQTPSITSVSGTYQGDVLGDYRTAGIGRALTGSFDCQVNLSGGSGQVSNFNMSATGVDVSASITGASGNIGSDYQFKLNGGVWNLNGQVPLRGTGTGSLYGPDGGYIGGVWGMSTDNAAATGIFHGAKTTP
jgi:hypothetical protein